MPKSSKDLVLRDPMDVRVLITGKRRRRHASAGAADSPQQPARRQAVPGDRLCRRYRMWSARVGAVRSRARQCSRHRSRSREDCSNRRTAARSSWPTSAAVGRALQARLLRFLEDGEIRRVGADVAHTKVDVRVISSADAHLFERTEAMTFSGGSLLPAERDPSRHAADWPPPARRSIARAASVMSGGL